jgi:hypothetical protein
MVLGGQRVEEAGAQDGAVGDFCGGQEAFAAELDVPCDLRLDLVARPGGPVAEADSAQSRGFQAEGWMLADPGSEQFGKVEVTVDQPAVAVLAR